jgi:hypothetical protein
VLLARRRRQEDAKLGSKARVAEMSSTGRLVGRRAPLDAGRPAGSAGSSSAGGVGAAYANPLLSPWLRRSQGVGGAPRRMQLALPALPHTAHSHERPSLQGSPGEDGGAEEDLDLFWQQQQRRQQQEDAWGSVNPLHRQPRALHRHPRNELKQQPPSRFSRQYHSPERDTPPRRGGHWETTQRSLAGSEERRAAAGVAAQQSSGWPQRAAPEQLEWGDEEQGEGEGE